MTFAHLVERLQPGRFDVVGDEPLHLCGTSTTTSRRHPDRKEKRISPLAAATALLQEARERASRSPSVVAGRWGDPVGRSGGRPRKQSVALSTVRKVERETGFEPATFCLGSPGPVSVVA
jgi:hypothetical protein